VRPFAGSRTQTQNHRVFLLTCKVETHTAAHIRPKKVTQRHIESSKYLALINIVRGTSFYWAASALDKCGEFHHSELETIGRGREIIGVNTKGGRHTRFKCW
jgi:hypothetical protein